MITVCGWHKLYLPSDPIPTLKDDGVNDGRVSHGLCGRCKDIFYRDFPDEVKKAKGVRDVQ